MTYKFLKVNLKNGLQTIQFNRSDRKNAFSTQMIDEIRTALENASVNEEVVITVLTGQGTYYSSGNDLNNFQFAGSSDLESLALQSIARFQKFISAFIEFPKILVAVVNGPAIGVAVTTLGLCDVVYSSDKATFQTPFTSLGLVAEGCSSYTFPRIMGKGRAAEMLYFNKKLNAYEAKDYGLVTEVITHECLPSIWRRLEELSQLPRQSLLYSKKLVCERDREVLCQVNKSECKQLAERFQSEDCINAVVNYFQKRSKL